MCAINFVSLCSGIENDKPAMSADRVNELKMSLKASQSVTRQVRSSPSSIPGMNNKIARKKNNSVETSQSWKVRSSIQPVVT